MIKPSEIKVRYYNFHRTARHWVSDEYRAMSIKQRISEGTKKAMASEKVRNNFLKGLETRDCRSSDIEVRAKRSKSMKDAMAKKFPIEDRKVGMEFGSEEYREFMRNSTSDLWKRPGFKESTGAKISASLKGKPKTVNMLWWNNGLLNTRKPQCPGDGWTRGKLKTKHADITVF